MLAPLKKKSIDRLKRAQGQIAGIIKMVEEDKYCTDVITQVLAVQGALKGTIALILESHLYTCGMEHFSSNNSKKKEKFIKELVKISGLSGR